MGSVKLMLNTSSHILLSQNIERATVLLYRTHVMGGMSPKSHHQRGFCTDSVVCIDLMCHLPDGVWYRPS